MKEPCRSTIVDVYCASNELCGEGTNCYYRRDQHRGGEDWYLRHYGPQALCSTKGLQYHQRQEGDN